jgi:zinc protease
MRKLLIFIVLFVAQAAHAQGLSFVRQVHQISEHRLPNGLQVLFIEDNSRPQATVNMTYRVGSRHEGPGEYGSAHLLEHMLFKAAGNAANPKYKKPILEMQQLGMRWNGTTNTDRTNYFAHFSTGDTRAAERLEYMIGWLSAMMTQAQFTQADLNAEMTVVRNEFERANSEPGRVLGERMRAAAYSSHPYNHPTIGTLADIENMPFERLQAFYRLHYRPDNATLIVAGQFDMALVRRLIEREFGAIAKPSTALPETWSVEPVQEGAKLVELRRTGGAPQAAVLYHAPGSGQRDTLVASMYSEILAQKGGPLERGLTEQKYGLSEWAFYAPLREPGYFMAGMTLPEQGTRTSAAFDTDSRSALAALASVVETYIATAQDLERARRSYQVGVRSVWRNTEALAMQLSNAVGRGDYRLLAIERELIGQITLEEVQAFAKRHLIATNRTGGLYLPAASSSEVIRSPAKAAVKAQSIDQLFASTPLTTFSIANFVINSPAGGILSQFSIPTLGTATTATTTPQGMLEHTRQAQLIVGGKPGLKLGVMTRSTKDDRVHGTLRLRWGTLASIRGQSVLASMVAPLLTDGMAAGKEQGQEAMNTVQIKERLQELDASISFATAAGGLSASLEFPAANSVAVLGFMADLMRRPAFGVKEFEPNQNIMLSTMLSIKNNPASLAGNVLERNHSAHYPDGDPRKSRSFEDTEKLMREATRDKLSAFWQRFGSAQHGELALVGPIALDSVQPLMQQLLGDWGTTEPHEPSESEYGAPVGELFTQLKVTDKANANYNARISFPLNQQSPDFPALALGIDMFSRLGLWTRVREKEGLSYGVGASTGVPWLGNSASIDIGASFAPQNLAKLRSAVAEEISRAQNEGYSTLQVNTAKSGLLARRRESLNSPAAVAGIVAFNLQYNRAMDAYNIFTTAFEKLDAPSVNAALKKYLGASPLREVTAGTFEP